MTTFNLTRRVVAELLGTAILVATVVGSGIMATKLTKDIGLALLGNTLPTGAILVVLILIFGPVSGAHFNPAVSLVMAQRARMPWGEVGPYVVAQVVGGIAGSLIAHLMFDLPVWQASQTVRAGGAQWFAEFVATFGLVLTIFGIVRFRPESAPVAVGLYITAAYWFTASTSFANPAVTIARAFTDTFAGIAPANVPAFVVAQVIGALAASALAAWLFAPGPQPRA
jgi:glycerol uptake facilitator-like aquaporin